MNAQRNTQAMMLHTTDGKGIVPGSNEDTCRSGKQKRPWPKFPEWVPDSVAAEEDLLDMMAEEEAAAAEALAETGWAG